MSKSNIEAIAARLDVLAIMLQELARVLTPAQSMAVADTVRLRVAELAARDLLLRRVSAEVDQALPFRPD